MLTLHFTPFPNLTTERLILRQLKIDDDKAILAIRSNASVNKYLDRQPTASIEEARSFINNINDAIYNNESVYWAITLKTDAALIGTICYWNISKEKDAAEIGYELHPDFQGKGLMQEAITKVIDFGFEQMQLQIITACPSIDNNKSIQLLEKNHFVIDTNIVSENEQQETTFKTITYSLRNEFNHR